MGQSGLKIHPTPLSPNDVGFQSMKSEQCCVCLFNTVPNIGGRGCLILADSEQLEKLL